MSGPRRSPPRRAHDGYLLIALLVLLLPGALGVVVLTSGEQVARTARSERDAIGELERIRDRLIAYATRYDALYGPQGAGPGHLPCPDTDAPIHRRWPPRAGPNPPCGAGPVAIGRLPAAVSPGAARYRFHVRPDQRFRYRVSTAFVNNPLDRVVNPASAGDLMHGDDQDVVAVIGVGAASLAIRTGDLLEPLIARVRLWLVDRLERRLVAVQACDDRAQMALPVEDWRAWLVDERAACDPTAGSSHPGMLARATLERVPLERHWFVRNGWPEHVDIDISEPCRIDRTACRWTTPVTPEVDSTVGVANASHERAVRLRLVRVS